MPGFISYEHKARGKPKTSYCFYRAGLRSLKCILEKIRIKMHQASHRHVLVSTDNENGLSELLEKATAVAAKSMRSCKNSRERHDMNGGKAMGVNARFAARITPGKAAIKRQAGTT